MRPSFLLLPLALANASWAANSLPSYDFAVKPAIPSTTRIKPLKNQKPFSPLDVQPRVPLGDLDAPQIEIKPSSNIAGSRHDPKFADSFSIGKSLDRSGPVQLQPRNSGFSPHPAPRDTFPWPQLNIKQSPVDGRQQAIPMHMLPPLPPQRLR
ncbi:hypothetical protein ABGV49_04440 [Chromobacterium vaccinii]|uniref:Uncharacterized protein n=1 Tax=Chromobacterium vaccinii TaxID=1108595 RepID=A0ABV0FCG8_9NEIS